MDYRPEGLSEKGQAQLQKKEYKKLKEQVVETFQPVADTLGVSLLVDEFDEKYFDEGKFVEDFYKFEPEGADAPLGIIVLLTWDYYWKGGYFISDVGFEKRGYYF